MEMTNVYESFEDMTKKLIAQVIKEADLKAISPEMIREIRECVKLIVHGFR